jgi:hypothetical protein
VSFELTARERRSVMRRIWWARGLIVLLLACLVFGWGMGGPIIPRVIGTILNLLWTAGMVMYIRRQQRQLNMVVGRDFAVTCPVLGLWNGGEFTENQTLQALVSSSRFYGIANPRAHP